MEVVTVDESDSEFAVYSQCQHKCNSNLRSGGLVSSNSSSSCGQEDGDCNESHKEFDERNDENQDFLEDHGEDLMRYNGPIAITQMYNYEETMYITT